MSSLSFNHIPLTFQHDGEGKMNLQPLSTALYENRERYQMEKSHSSAPFKIPILKEHLAHTYIKLKRFKLEKGEEILSCFKYREFKRCLFTSLSNGEKLTDGAKEVLFKKCNLKGKFSFKNVKHLCFDGCDFSDATFSGSKIDTITFLNSNISSSKNENLHQREKHVWGVKGLPKIKRLELISDRRHVLDLKYFNFLLKESQAKSVLIKKFRITGVLSALPRFLKQLEIDRCHLTSPRIFTILRPNVKVVQLTDITTNGKQLTISDSVQSIFLKEAPFNSFKLPKTLKRLTLLEMDLEDQCKKLPNITKHLVLKKCSLTSKDQSILKNRFSECVSLIKPNIVDASENGILIENMSLADFPLEKIKPTDQWIHCKKVQLANGEDRVSQFTQRAFENCSLIKPDKEKLLQGAKIIYLWNVKLEGLIPIEAGASCEIKHMDLKGASFPNARLKEVEISNSSLDGILSFPNTDSLGFYSCLGLKGVLPLIKKPLKKLTIGSMKQFILDCSSIPKGLNELRVYDTSIDSGAIGSLPSSLKKLDLDRIKGGPINCSKLPKGIETLILSSITINSNGLPLPSSIKYLKLSEVSLNQPLASPFPIENNFHSLQIDSSILNFLCFTTKSVPSLNLTDFSFETTPLHARSKLPIASKQLALYRSIFSLSDLKALMGTSIESLLFIGCELRRLTTLPEFLSNYSNLKQVTIKYSNTDRKTWNRLKAPIALSIDSKESKKLSIINN